MNDTKFKLTVLIGVLSIVLSLLVMMITPYTHVALFLLLIAFTSIGIAAMFHEEKIFRSRGNKYLS